uniref:Retrovirus-related Pol polyprotein from transposon gypsy n=1 Tax=Bactrocera latifrons TaxID=174628 RepID=A0A0K8VE13_BACLA
MDIFHIGNRTYITSMCRYSKYLLMREMADKVNTVDTLEEILTLTYPDCRNLQTDNESIFTSITCMLLYRRLHITHNRAPTAHSTSNGSVERLHIKLIEIAGTLAKQNNTDSVTEIFNAAYEYTRTIHSVTKQKPVEVFFNRKNYPEIKQLIEKKKTKF